MAYKNKEDYNKWRREYYKKNSTKMKKKAQEKRKRTAGRNRDFLIEYKKTHECEFCKEDDFRCLVFHHKDGEVKKNDVARLVSNGSSLKVLNEEIEKCNMLCANCHSKIHFYVRLAE